MSISNGEKVEQYTSVGVRAVRLILVGLVGLIANVLLPILLGTFIDDYHFTLRQAGMLAAVYMLGGGIGPCVAGLLLARVKTTRLTQTFLILVSLGNADPKSAYTLFQRLLASNERRAYGRYF